MCDFENCTVNEIQKSLPQVCFRQSSSKNLDWRDLLSAAVCQSQLVAKLRQVISDLKTVKKVLESPRSSFDLCSIWTQICSLVTRLSSFVFTDIFTVPSVSINANIKCWKGMLWSMWTVKASSIIKNLASWVCNLLWCQILHILPKCWIFSSYDSAEYLVYLGKYEITNKPKIIWVLTHIIMHNSVNFLHYRMKAYRRGHIHHIQL